jgi:hypothetical protein
LSGSCAFSVPNRAALVTIISVNPMMALSGVRSSWLILPGIITYDTSARRYVPDGKYRSVTGWTPKRLAAWQAAWEAGVEGAW